MWTFFWWIFTSIVGAYLAPKPNDAAASSLGDFQVPTAEEGRNIAYMAGTCQVKGPNVTWWGDLFIEAIKEKTSGFFGFGSKSYTVGYKYHLGMQMMLCVGRVDRLIDIVVGDKSLAAKGAFTPKDYAAAGIVTRLAASDLFGGKKQEGGIEGDLAFYFGSESQAGDPYLAGAVGKAVPGYRGVCHAVLRRMYIGTSAYPKNWAWVLGRWPCPAGFDAAKKAINGDANAAYVIADMLTSDPEWGCMGLSAARLDKASFQSCANTLFAEGFGISILMDKEQGADAWIGEICRTVDAVLFTDPATGLWTLKLIRADYEPATIPSFTEGDLLGAPEITRPSWADTLNKVVIRYMDRAQGFTIRTAQERDEANRSVRGEEATGVFDYFAVSNMANAQVVAARERKINAWPLAKVHLQLNRKAWNLRPGSPFKFNWSPFGIHDLVLRVSQIRYGLMGQGITIDAVEDVFGVTTAVFTPPPVSEWSDPIAEPVAPAAQALVEAPYWTIGESRNILALAARGDVSTLDMDIYTSQGNLPYQLAGKLSIPAPTGLLTAAWPCKRPALDSVGFTVGSGVDLSRLPGLSTDQFGRARGVNLGICGNEWFSWTTCTDNGDGTFTCNGVLRGILDTVPEDHAQGDRIWFVLDGSALTLQDEASGSSGTGPQGIPGSVGPQGRSYVWHPSWDQNHPYLADDTCGYNGSSYVALVDNLNNRPDLYPGSWSLMAQKGEPGEPGPAWNPTRRTAAVTTGTLNDGASEAQNITLAKTTDILKVTTDYPAWVRLYDSDGARTADQNRAITADPGAGIGLVMEVLTSVAQPAILMSPVPTFANLESPSLATGYLTITNKSGASRAINVSILHLPREI